MEHVNKELFLRARSPRPERQFPWQLGQMQADTGVQLEAKRDCADNEGKRKGEIVENGDEGCASAQE